MVLTDTDRDNACSYHLSCHKSDGFHKVIDLKDHGFTVFSRVYPTYRVDIARKPQDMVIAQNPDKLKLTSDDVQHLINENKITCPRCRQLLKHTQELMSKMSDNTSNEIIGVCGRCYLKALSQGLCEKCTNVAIKFLALYGPQKKLTSTNISAHILSYSDIDFNLFKPDTPILDNLEVKEMFESQENSSYVELTNKPKKKHLNLLYKDITHKRKETIEIYRSKISFDTEPAVSENEKIMICRAKLGQSNDYNNLNKEGQYVQEQMKKYGYTKREIEHALTPDIAKYRKILESNKRAHSEPDVNKDDKDISYLFPDISQPEIGQLKKYIISEGKEKLGLVEEEELSPKMEFDSKDRDASTSNQHPSRESAKKKQDVTNNEVASKIKQGPGKDTDLNKKKRDTVKDIDTNKKTQDTVKDIAAKEKKQDKDRGSNKKSQGIDTDIDAKQKKQETVKDIAAKEKKQDKDKGSNKKSQGADTDIDANQKKQESVKDTDVNKKKQNSGKDTDVNTKQQNSAKDTDVNKNKRDTVKDIDANKKTQSTIKDDKAANEDKQDKDKKSNKKTQDTVTDIDANQKKQGTDFNKKKQSSEQDTDVNKKQRDTFKDTDVNKKTQDTIKDTDANKMKNQDKDSTLKASDAQEFNMLKMDGSASSKSKADDSKKTTKLQKKVSLKNNTNQVDSDLIIEGEHIAKQKAGLLEHPHESKNYLDQKEPFAPLQFQKEFKFNNLENEKKGTKRSVSTTEPVTDSQSVADSRLGLNTKKQGKAGDNDNYKGIIRFALSDRAFIEKGWTFLPTEKVVRKMNVYKMRPAQPQFDWFERNKNKEVMTYNTGEKLAEFDPNGRGRWYYRNGRLALDYYDAEETNAQQRFVVYSSGEPDDRGRTHPITILATFDYLGNGVVFDNTGKIRLKYNQTEGVVLDRKIGPVTHWKWHTLNDPPDLQKVMIDTQMSYKDQTILSISESTTNKKTVEEDKDMIAIELDNLVKKKKESSSSEKSPFTPFQVKMKALKINEHFSLKVLDQATVYLIFRDGSTNIRLNLGMILDHQEIIGTDTSDVGEVSNSLERYPAATGSIEAMQRSIELAQRFERTRTERARKIRPIVESASIDKLLAASSKPYRPMLSTLPVAGSQDESNYDYCRCRKKVSCCNVYYNSRIM